VAAVILDYINNNNYYYYYYRSIYTVCFTSVATSSCRRHVDELATEPSLLLHREHGTGYQRS